MIINVKAIEVNPYLNKQTVSVVFQFVFWLVTNHKSLQSFIPATHSFFLNISTLSRHLLNIELSSQPFDALNLVSASIPLAICKASSCRSGPRHVSLFGYAVPFVHSIIHFNKISSTASLSVLWTIGIIFSSAWFGRHRQFIFY